MIIKSLTALTALILEAFGVYCEGEFKWGCGYVEATSTNTVLSRSVSSWTMIKVASYCFACVVVGTLIWQLF